MVNIRLFSTEARTTPDYETAINEVSKAEFRLGEDGRVKELGVVPDPEMGEAKIWFKKAGADNDNGYGTFFTAGSSAVNTESNLGASGAGGQGKLFFRSGKRLAPLFA